MNSLLILFISTAWSISYQEIENNTPNSFPRSEIISCEPQDIEPWIGSGRLFYKSATSNAACSCTPWGNCSSDVCRCSDLCPDNFYIFNKNEVKELKDYSSEENSLAFRNHDTMSLNNPHYTGFGHCGGHAILTQRFNRLAIFQNHKKGWRAKLNSASTKMQAKKHYAALIQSIAQNKITEIPGFKNLNEFSKHPELKNFFLKEVYNLWEGLNLTASKILFSASLLYEQKINYEDLFNNIKSKLDMFQQPIIEIKLGPLSLHTLLVSHHKINHSGNTLLCLRDSNAPPWSNYNCITHLKMNKQGQLLHNIFITISDLRKKYKIVSGIGIIPSDEADAITHFAALRKFCGLKKNCPDYPHSP